jgi:diacylglycerol kinase (ATP)
MLSFLRSRIASFKPAFYGWWHVFRTQPNAWVHAIVSLAVFAVAYWLDFDRQDWALTLLTVGFVWLAEFFNTAVEVVVDLVTLEQHPLAKLAKDVGAAAVVIAAIVAVAVGLLIFGPPLWARLSPLF